MPDDDPVTIQRPAALRTRTPVLSAVTRILAVLAAAFWGVFFFGLIDLLVVPLQDEQFHEFYLLETGWGLLFTALVAAPLVAFAVSPRSYVFVLQLLAVAAAVLLGALVVPAPRQLVPGLVLAVTAALAWFGTGYRLQPLRALGSRRPGTWLVALVALAMVAASAYAWHALSLARSAEPDEITRGLMHLPMQASFALALAASAAVSVLAASGSAYGWRASTLPPAAAAIWFGVVSIGYPDVVCSLGRAGGITCILWGAAFVAAAFGGQAGEDTA